MNLEQVAKELAEYKDLLLFETGLHPDKGEVTLVRSKQFMRGEKGKETWIRINEIVKRLGGEWVSLGKESHWIVPSESKPLSSEGLYKCPYCGRSISVKIGGA